MAFELLLFSTDPPTIAAARSGGVDGFIVDREVVGKRRRQARRDTQINAETTEDLARTRRAAGDATVLCRVNSMEDPVRCLREIDEAHAAGAEEILLPMVVSVEEVETVLDHCDRTGGPQVGILIETTSAIEVAAQLGQLPLRRVYVGLNDLAIERGIANIFESLVDGTVEALRGAITVPFGVAGLTLPGLGQPIPCNLLLAEIVRLGCEFTFLRRSFLHDGAAGGYAGAARRIVQAVEAELRRPVAERERDHRRLVEAVASAPDPAGWRQPPSQAY